MEKSLLILLFVLILGACGQIKSNNNEKELEADSTQDSSFWVPLSENDSIKYLRSTQRVFNQGKDSIMFIHYVTGLYNTRKDADNPKFKKQALKLINRISKEVKLPDTLYLQAMGNQNGSIVKKRTDFNILAGNNEGEWTIKDGEIWKSLKDFEN